MWPTLKLIFGVVLYLLELALNLNAFFQYAVDNRDVSSWFFHAHGSSNSFWGILVVVFFATVFVNIVAIRNRSGLVPGYCYGLAFILQLCPVVRYFEEFHLPDREESLQLLRVRFARALFNSGPQCILHGYIMVEAWNFPSYTIASLAVSFISLVWGLYSWGLYSFPPSHPELSTFDASLLVVGKLGFIIFRLVLLTFFLYSLAYYTPLVLAPFILISIYCILYLVQYLFCCYLCVESCECCDNFLNAAIRFGIVF